MGSASRRNDDVERLRVSIDHLREGVQVIDRAWRYVYLNEAAAAHGQRPARELIGRTMMECYPGIDATPLFDAMRAVMETRQPATLRNEFTFPTGERRWFDLLVDPVPEGICVLSLDISDRQKIENELHHLQRLDALGKLAGGVAHDFNNQLTAILGFTDLLLEDVRDENQRKDLQAVKEAAQRSTDLTRQLLTFSRRQPLRVELTDLNDVLLNLGRMLPRLLPEQVRLEISPRAGCPKVMADVRQLENALTNLVANARDAMPDGGRLTVETTTASLTADDVRQHPSMVPGRYAVLVVTDTGIGMDQATQNQIFEPFFTTKEEGKGTGLGLSMVYGAIRQMGGFIWVYSEVGRGTTFRLYFPAADRAALPPEEEARPDEWTEAAGRSVFVVEDDAGVREFIARTLRKHGYAVSAAGTSDEARRQLNGMAEPPDLVMTDIVVPGGTGPDLIQTLTRRPRRVLFMSGYAGKQIESVALRRRFLQKPFTARDLLDAVRRSLGERAQG